MFLKSITYNMETIAKSIILFPGQGSQFVGMAKNLSQRGRSLFDIANEVLRYDLLKLCNNGPESELNQTIYSQPAVFVSSLAAVENLAVKSQGAIENCIATAGFSVGEFAALVFAQSIDFVDALKFLHKRATLSNAIGTKIPSGMMTVILGTDGRINQACSLAKEYCIRIGMNPDESICAVTNHLFPHAKIIGGHNTALEFIEENKSDFGIRRLKRLAVSTAFHTHLMKPTLKSLQNSIDKVKIEDPKIKVYSNITSFPYKNAEEIRKLIPQHIYKPVMWEQIIHNMYEGELPVTFECGPQNQMTTILGMINKKARLKAYNIST